MDDVSHILWSVLLFWWTGDPVLAALFGVLPDLICFVPMVLVSFRTKMLKAEFPKEYHKVPGGLRRYAEESYKWTHNIFTATIMGGLGALTGQYWMLAWPVHVLMDIPTHTAKFYPTPILWPFSDWSFDGLPWTDKRVWIPNALALLVGYALLVKSIIA